MFCQVRDFWGLCERKFSSKLAWIQIFHPLNIRSMLPVLRNVYISEYNRFMDQNVQSSPNGCYIYLTISQTRQVLRLTQKASGSVKLTTIRPAKRSLFRDFPKLPVSFMLQFAQISLLRQVLGTTFTRQNTWAHVLVPLYIVS